MRSLRLNQRQRHVPALLTLAQLANAEDMRKRSIASGVHGGRLTIKYGVCGAYSSSLALGHHTHNRARGSDNC